MQSIVLRTSIAPQMIARNRIFLGHAAGGRSERSRWMASGGFVTRDSIFGAAKATSLLPLSLSKVRLLRDPWEPAELRWALLPSQRIKIGQPISSMRIRRASFPNHGLSCSDFATSGSRWLAVYTICTILPYLSTNSFSSASWLGWLDMFLHAISISAAIQTIADGKVSWDGKCRPCATPETDQTSKVAFPLELAISSL